MSQPTWIAVGSRLLVLLCGLGAVITSPAANLTFLQSSPIYYFQDDDVSMMLANAKAVLDSVSSGTQQHWRNPRTGASGMAQVKGRFAATDGTPCARLRVVNKARGVESDIVYTVCKNPERGWAVDPDAKPPAPAP
jgi:hypothetical protein